MASRPTSSCPAQLPGGCGPLVPAKASGNLSAARSAFGGFHSSQESKRTGVEGQPGGVKGQRGTNGPASAALILMGGSPCSPQPKNERGCPDPSSASGLGLCLFTSISSVKWGR